MKWITKDSFMPQRIFEASEYELRLLSLEPSFYFILFIFFIIWFVRLLALRPLLAYCANLG
jgi:hypothetical protein